MIHSVTIYIYKGGHCSKSHPHICLGIYSVAKGNTCFPESVSETDLLFVFSSEAMEERYEHKTQARIQELVRIYLLDSFWS